MHCQLEERQTDAHTQRNYCNPCPLNEQKRLIMISNSDINEKY